MADNVKVAVRVRPYNQREKDRKSNCCITMKKETQQTIIVDGSSGRERVFTFDYSYNSFVPRDHADYASQTTVWSDIGVGVLENAYNGYNCSLFAYGQTGAGKSYSMMGYGEDKGIIPIACERIFDRIDSNTDDSLTIKVETSMLEIYMEKIRDLFNPKAGDLKIRNDPKNGFYVEKLTRNAVGNYASIDKLMEAGTKARTVASTNMNATSSRAHTIFQIVLTQTKVDHEVGKATDKVAIINLIDLAGSERQSGTGATGARLKEGSAINLSLSSLGNCISALAHNSGDGKKVRVPYRDSVLTMLLQNSLGGNAKTIMIAAISPADINHDETLSTLRYADRAKQIKNKAVVNEDPNQKLIRNLRSEIEELRKALTGVPTGAGGAGAVAGGIDSSSMLEKEREEMRAKFEAEAEAQRAKIREELELKLKQEMEESKTWEERLRETDARQAEREAELRARGVLTGAEREAALERAKTTPHITNLHEDHMMSEQILHFFPDGSVVKIGREDAPEPQDVNLAGLAIEQQHATVAHADGKITLHPATESTKISVNGSAIHQDTELHHMDRVLFGNNHWFKVVLPAEAESWTPEPDMPSVIDHSFAVLELNKAQVNMIAAAEAKRRAEAEEARAAAEQKIAEYQAMMEQEKEKAEAEAKEREELYAKKAQELEAMKSEGMEKELKEQEERLEKEKQALHEEMAKQREELETRLQAQIEETNKMARRKEQEMHQRSVLDEQLLRTIPLVNEANAYSEELGQGVTFSVKLMANPARKAHWETKANEEGEAEEQFVLDTEIYVRVEASDASVPDRFWNHDKFTDRLYTMREMYQEFVEAGRSLDESDYLMPDNDPFFDKPEDILVGRATAYLDPLVYVMHVDEWLPIMDYKGKNEGQLHVKIVPHRTPEPPAEDAEDDEDDEDEIDNLEQLKGQQLYITVSISAARGIPAEKSVNPQVKFRLFLEEQTETPTLEGKSINPKINFSKTYSFIVTDELCTYVSTEAIDFEVWGRSNTDSFRPQSVLDGPPPGIGAGAGAGGGGLAGAGGRDSPMVQREMDEMRKKVAEEERQRVQRELDEMKQKAKEAEDKIKAELEAARVKVQEAEEQAKLLKDQQTKLPAGTPESAASAQAAADPTQINAMAEDNAALKRRLEEMEAKMLAAGEKKSSTCSIL